MSASNAAQIWAVIGASGTGKGLWIKQQLAALQPARLVCWDFKNEYGDYARPVETLEGIRRAMLTPGPGRYAFATCHAGPVKKTFEKSLKPFASWSMHGGSAFLWPRNCQT